MKRALVYFGLQCKRFFKLFPFVFLLTVILCAAVGITLYNVASANADDEQKQPVRIGVVGGLNDSYFEMGLAAARNLDETRFSVEFLTLDEDQAAKMLNRGELAAYLILPENFVTNAVHGDIGKINYVSSAGTVDFGTKITNDMLKAVARVVVNAQKAVYGFQDAAVASGVDEKVADEFGSRLAKIAIDVILKRTALVTVEMMEPDGFESDSGSLLCGMTVLFIMLWGITCCSVFSARRQTLSRVLKADGFGVGRQIAGEYAAYLVFMIAALGIAFACAFFALGAFGGKAAGLLSVDRSSVAGMAAGLLPVMTTLSAMQFFIYELSSGIVSGVLSQFVTSVALGYVCGCMYPVYFFPEAVQRVSAYLPAGAARIFLSAASRGKTDAVSLAMLAGYAFLFVVLSALTRKIRNGSSGGGI